MNLNLVIDTSQFKPLEWYKAAVDTMKDYGTTYQRYEDALNKIAEEKGEYVLPESSKYKGVMDLYNTDFDAIVGDFGRTMNTRILLNVRDMRKRYHSEISPIRKMVENYNKAMDKLTALGPDAIIGGKDLLTNVDTYYGGVNPTIDYRSDKTIQQTAAGIMQGLDNALMSAPKLAGSIAKQYMILRQLGLDGANALNEILKMLPSLNNELAANDMSLLAFALDKVYSHFAFKDPNTPENRAIWESVVTGAILGIQAPKYAMQQDREYLDPTQRYSLKQLRLEDLFKYEYKDGKIVGWNDKYLEGLSSRSRNKNPVQDPTSTYEQVGNFISHDGGKASEVIADSVTNIPTTSVPSIYRQLNPKAVGWKVAKNKKGKVVGYYPVFKKVDKDAYTDSNYLESDGEEED